jgi:diguanylate cyclase (GGDEF)-like protein
MSFVTEKLLSRRSREVNFLFEIESLLLSRDEQGAYLLLPPLMKEIVDYDLCAVFGWDSDEEELSLIATEGEQGVLPAKSLSGTLAESALHAGGPIYISDLLESEGEVNPYPFVGDVRSVLAVPMRSYGYPVGVIQIGSRQPEAFSQEDMELADIFGRKAAHCVLHLRQIPTPSDYFDPVTRAYRYPVFLDHLRKEINFSRRNKFPTSLIYIDLDGFDEYNRRYGYKAGDRMLNEMTSAIRETIRAEDLVCRYGGDEFLVMLTRADKEGAFKVAQRIRNRIQGDGNRLSLTMGIASCPRDVDHPETLVELAQRAMERGKEAGGNTIQTLSETDVRELVDLFHVKPPLGYSRTNAWDSLTDEFLWLALTMLTQALEVERASLMILDPKEDLLKFEVTKNLDETVRRRVKVRVGEGIAGKALMEGRTIWAADVEGEGVPSEEGRGYRSNSFICAPILRGERRIGVINLTDKSDDEPFSEHEERIVEEFAAVIAETLTDMRVRYTEGVGKLCDVLEKRSPFLEGYSKRVSQYARRIAQGLDLPPERADYLAELGLLRELGEIGMDELLSKPGPLEERDRRAIEGRMELMGRIFSGIRFLRPYAEPASHHHDRFDSNGISLESRIIAVAEAYVAMTSPRAYRPAMSSDEALSLLHQEAGGRFDPMVVQALSGAVASEAGFGQA